MTAVHDITPEGDPMSDTEPDEGQPATVPADALIPASEISSANGDQLDAALAAAGLPKTGKVDEKRERLGEYMAQGGHREPGDPVAAFSTAALDDPADGAGAGQGE